MSDTSTLAPQQAAAGTTTVADANQVRRMLPPQVRSGSISPASYNEGARTVEVTGTTGAKVRRMDLWTGQVYDEELVVTEAAVDMSRLNSGAAPVLDTHNARSLASQIGVVLSARLEGNTGVATVQLSEREELAGIVRDIATGILRNISVGYSVRKYEIVSAANRTDGKTDVPLYRAVDWEPAELSFVPVPADHLSGTRSAETQHGTPCLFVAAPGSAPGAALDRAPAQDLNTSTRTIMPIAQADGAVSTATETVTPVAAAGTPAAAAPAQRADAGLVAADITDLCVRHNVPQLAANLIRSGKTLDQAREAVLTELAARDASAGGHVNRGTSVHTVQDEMQTRMAGMEQAILHRVDPKAKLDDNGQQYRGQTLLELARSYLEARGVNTRGMDRMQLAGTALHFRSGGGMHTTSDFSALFANIANKRLRGAYDENPGTYTQWARRAPNAPDFKTMSVVQLSGGPELLPVNEHGEFKYGRMTDGGESYALATYGRIVPVSRQSIVNDDLRSFDRLTTAFGFSSRRLENRLVYAELTGNRTMGDGGALFNATALTTAGGHANLATGAGSALQLSALATGRTAMRLQRGLAGEELNLRPSYLIVPATQESVGLQLTSANYVPATTATINEFRAGGRTAVELIVEPILDGTSTTAWYLAAASAQVDTVEFCYLDGAEGPVIEQEVGFDVDGVSLKARLDFAARVVDWRGLYRAAGA
jgi:hypothetical protein